jgi:hypothetical protein
MRVDPAPRFPADSGQLIRKLTDLFRDYGRQVNDFTEGRIAAVTNAATEAPTMGTYRKGDTLRNSEPEVVGVPPWQYVIVGWVCTEGGTPGTWQEMAVATTLAEQQEALALKMSSQIELMAGILAELRVLTHQLAEGFGNVAQPETIRRAYFENVER